MELVRGTPITRHCDDHLLGTSERLRLFIQVCSAIQHVHQKGIIYCDLKSSNILVILHDGVSVPKIIDFGIAKAMHGRLTDRTLFTAFEQFIGTPAYMSPEQTEMSGLDVDTRSDIYSLGVLLYELLTGRTPFESQELMKASLDEMRRTIREKEPARPSTRVSFLNAADGAAIARQRGTELAKLRSWLSGDMDWIVMRCLEKDRARRYETANGLSMDLQRFLHNEPVVARPPGTGYVLRKLVRRNKLVFAAAGAVLVTLVAGLAFSTWSLARERAAREQAQIEAARSAEVARFMEDMLAGVGPQVARGRDTELLRSILDETVERLHRELRSQPVVAAGLRETLGNVYRDLNELRAAALMHETALQMRREIHGPEHVIVAGLLANFAETLARQDRLTEAETMLREALAMRERLQGRDDADVVTTRAALENVRLRQRQAGQSRGEPVPTHRAPPVGGALGSDSALPGDPPLVIRIAHTGGRSTGQTFNSGNLISTADQLDVLEREFAADGVPVKWLYFPGGAATHEAMARGEVDFASWGYLAQAKGLDQKLLLRPGSNGTGLNYLITRADAPYESLDDLVGRSLGSVKGTAGHLHLCRILERHGFAQADFTIKFYPDAAALSAALQAEEVDGYYMTRPAQLVATGKAKVIHDATGEVPRYDSGGGFLVSGEFERRHPAVVQRVVTVIVKLAAWHSDKRNREEIFAAWS
ncbi:MAG TPA: protein kinase, partial [Opitutaceae bacterium]